MPHGPRLAPLAVTVAVLPWNVKALQGSETAGLLLSALLILLTEVVKFYWVTVILLIVCV